MPTFKQHPKHLFFILTFSIFVLVSCHGERADFGKEFLGERAFNDLSAIYNLGPRLPGTEAHQMAIDYIVGELKIAAWKTEVQEIEYQGVTIKNIIAKKGNGESWILLGAHYDTRLIADQDPVVENRNQPVPGANDGASGDAVLLELARVIPNDINKEVWLVFFDYEDNGGYSDTDWILGSRAFAQELTSFPDAVVIVDMIGDSDLNIYLEKNSNQELESAIWGVAKNLGNMEFIAEENHSMIDDHTPFVQLGIPTVLIIDFDYPYWHTIEDTIDKVSPLSLKAVGETLFQWLLSDP